MGGENACAMVLIMKKIRHGQLMLKNGNEAQRFVGVVKLVDHGI